MDRSEHSPPGELWREAIHQALEACDFGPLMLSPDFFASGFITGTELCHFIETHAAGGHQGPQAHRPRGPSSDTPGRPGGPPGLEQVQVFRDRDQRWFDRTKGHIRTDFADQLAGTNRPSPRRWSLIHTRVRRIIRGPGGRWNYGTIPGIERSLTKPVPGIRFCSPSPQLLSHQAGLPNYNSVENNGLEMSNA